MTRAVVAALAALALLAVAGLAASPAASRGELEVRHYRYRDAPSWVQYKRQLLSARDTAVNVCSAKQSSADLASFFDSLPGTNSHSVLPNARHEHAKHRAQIQKAMHSKAQTAKHSNSKVTETKKIGDDGLPVEFRKKTAAQEAYDKEHQENAQKLRDYKRQNPDFKEKMDKVQLHRFHLLFGSPFIRLRISHPSDRLSSRACPVLCKMPFLDIQAFRSRPRFTRIGSRSTTTCPSPRRRRRSTPSWLRRR
jgi:hypothetical protein